jgi:hypothetical protein
MNILLYFSTKRRITKFAKQLNAARNLGLHIVCFDFGCATREASIFRILCLEAGIASTFTDLYFKIESKDEFAAPAFICNIHNFLQNIDHLSQSERDTELLLLLSDDNNGHFEKKIANLMLDVTFELAMHERQSRAKYAEHAKRVLHKAYYSEPKN